MKKFKYLEEDVNLSANVQSGKVGLDLSAVRDNINAYLNGVTSCTFVTPYIALERVSKVLANYHIFLPKYTFMEGDSGLAVFNINQFGSKVGMNDDGEVVTSDDSPFSFYFEYNMNDKGTFDVFAEIVDEEELQELMGDLEDEFEDDDSDTVTEEIRIDPNTGATRIKGAPNERLPSGGLDIKIQGQKQAGTGPKARPLTITPGTRPSSTGASPGNLGGQTRGFTGPSSAPEVKPGPRPVPPVSPGSTLGSFVSKALTKASLPLALVYPDTVADAELTPEIRAKQQERINQRETSRTMFDPTPAAQRAPLTQPEPVQPDSRSLSGKIDDPGSLQSSGPMKYRAAYINKTNLRPSEDFEKERDRDVLRRQSGAKLASQPEPGYDEPRSEPRPLTIRPEKRISPLPGGRGATMPGDPNKATGFGITGGMSTQGEIKPPPQPSAPAASSPQPAAAAKPAARPAPQPAAVKPAPQPAAAAKPAADTDPHAKSKAMFQKYSDEAMRDNDSPALFFAADKQRQAELRGLAKEEVDELVAEGRADNKAKKREALRQAYAPKKKLRDIRAEIKGKVSDFDPRELRKEEACLSGPETGSRPTPGANPTMITTGITIPNKLMKKKQMGEQTTPSTFSQARAGVGGASATTGVTPRRYSDPDGTTQRDNTSKGPVPGEIKGPVPGEIPQPKMQYKDDEKNIKEEKMNRILEACWKGYRKKGMKTMFGKRYPNCVKDD